MTAINNGPVNRTRPQWGTRVVQSPETAKRDPNVVEGERLPYPTMREECMGGAVLYE